LDRRTFVHLLGAVLVAQASVARAQRPAAPRVIGVLSADPYGNPDLWKYFNAKLRELGWVEGANLVFERRSANNQLDQLPVLAAELVRLNVDIIFAVGTQAPLAAKKATSAIPIVIMNAGDPVELGLASSLAHPGGNITGTSLISREIAGKRLQLLRGTLPGLSRVTLLLDPTNPNNALLLHETESAARTLGLHIQSIEVRGPEDFDGAFIATLSQRPGALITAETSVALNARARIAAFAAANRIPALYPFKEYVAAGGLMSYGLNLKDLVEVTAKYIDKILRGAKPGDLPIEQSIKFELVINLKAVKALGLTFPHPLLVRADEVIE
jgi:putative tryptophan/tyrosine transport system substrate-binding protein